METEINVTPSMPRINRHVPVFEACTTPGVRTLTVK